MCNLDVYLIWLQFTYEISFFKLQSVNNSVMSDSLWTPWTGARQAPLSMGFSRQEYWSGLPFPPPGEFPNPGIELGSPTLQADFFFFFFFFTGRFFTVWATREALFTGGQINLFSKPSLPYFILHISFSFFFFFFLASMLTARASKVSLVSQVTSLTRGGIRTQQWKHQVLTTGPRGSSLHFSFIALVQLHT